MVFEAERVEGKGQALEFAVVQLYITYASLPLHPSYRRWAWTASILSRAGPRIKQAGIDKLENMLGAGAGETHHAIAARHAPLRNNSKATLHVTPDGILTP